MYVYARTAKDLDMKAKTGVPIWLSMHELTQALKYGIKHLKNVFLRQINIRKFISRVKKTIIGVHNIYFIIFQCFIHKKTSLLFNIKSNSVSF